MSHKISRNDQYGDFIQNANTMHTKPFPDSSGTGIGSLDEFSDTMAPLQSAFTCSTTMMDFQKKMHHRILPKDTLESAHEGAAQIKADLFAHNDLTDTYSPVDFDQTEMDLMEIEGINDITEGESQDDDGNTFKVLDIYTDKNAFSKVVKEIGAKQLQIISYEIIKKAKDIVEAPQDYLEKIDNIVDILEEMDDVDFVWLNI